MMPWMTQFSKRCLSSKSGVQSYVGTAGMAHWAGTGRPARCEQCSFYGYVMNHPNNYYCYYYYVDALGRGAVAFPAETPSCQHFRPRSL
jgi:hypothetical protein